MRSPSYQKAIAAKLLRWIDDASHVELYDKLEYVDPAVEELAAFYRSNLS